MESYVDLAVFLIAGASFPALVIIGGALLRPHFPDPAKLTTYESGEIPFGDARVKYHAHYYIFALVFLVFDVETVFLYPWAVVFKTLIGELGAFVLAEMAVFIAMLVIGLVYAYKKRVLRWV